MRKFTIGSQWKTRGGHRAMIVSLGGLMTLGVWHEDGNIALGHTDNGMSKSELSNHDLIEPWQEPVVHEGWINVHKLYTEMHFYNDRENADADKNEGDSERIACIKIKFTEGEGL